MIELNGIENKVSFHEAMKKQPYLSRHQICCWRGTKGGLNGPGKYTLLIFGRTKGLKIELL